MHQLNTVSTADSFRAFDSTTALRPSRLLCPACKNRETTPVPLELIQAGEVEFYRCRCCAGAWFHEKDMDAALRATGRRDWPAPGEPKVDKAAAPVVIQVDWACPCCAGRLVAIHDRHGSGAIVRRCLVCYGGWMDHQDLCRASDASKHVLERLGQAVRGLWSR